MAFDRSVGHPRPNEKAIAKPAARAANDSIAITHTGYEDSAVRRRKTERNLRLLELEYAEQPEHPFTLFNLGWAYPGRSEPFEGKGRSRLPSERRWC